MKYQLMLFVTGQSVVSQRACRNMEAICRENLDYRYQLEVIDILEQPERAEADGILATPTLVKKLPLPQRKIIGDLSNHDEVLLGLDLHLSTLRENRL